MKKKTYARTVNAIAGTMLIGAIFSGCGPHKTEPVVPIEEGVWDNASDQYDCESGESLGTEYGEDIVCAADWNLAGIQDCSMTQSGNSYVVDCPISLGGDGCRVNVHVVGTAVIADRKHYTVEGTITITADPASCWGEAFPGEREGCTRVHEVCTWREPLYDGACSGIAKSRPLQIEDLRDPAKVLREFIRQHMAEKIGVVAP